MRPGARCKDMREAVHYRKGTYPHKCRRLLVLWCLLTVIAPGCGDDGEGSASDDPNAFTTDAPVLDEIQASIGTEGGVLEGLSDSLLPGVGRSGWSEGEHSPTTVMFGHATKIRGPALMPSMWTTKA